MSQPGAGGPGQDPAPAPARSEPPRRLEAAVPVARPAPPPGRPGLLRKLFAPVWGAFAAVGRLIAAFFGRLYRLIRGVIRLVIALALSLLVYLGICAFLALSAPYPNEQSGLYVPKGMVAGAYHVHSKDSDGLGTPWEIAQAAKHAGLSFVVLTDHNVARPPAPHFEDGVLVIHGVELSTPYGHLVALGVDRGLEKEERAADPISRVRKLGGVAFLAHPVQQKMPWTDWNGSSGAAGLELYSGDTMLREAEREPFSRLLPALGGYVTHPVHALMSLVQEQPEATRRLLELSAPAPRTALCAHDAHGFPSYETEFKTMALYLPAPDGMPGEASAAARWVIQSLASGSGYCVFRPLGEISDFSIEGLEGPRRAKVGKALRVILPPSEALEIRLKLAGPATLEKDGRTVRLEKPGAVQIEVWRRAPGFMGSEWRPWIVPSPIEVHQ